MQIRSEGVAVEDILSSKAKVLILKTLSQRDLNITAISTRVKVSHTRLKQYLQELEELGIVKHMRFGRILIYSMTDSLQANKIKQFFNSW
ncbi:MAG: winged helix-turn-helix transcriptional regulator [Candidatus Heimdallarchaeota archaeon]|nr:winged helix-turn-helix transcriptional regulator [Candidatus Heimdallarchaeota archaeon]